MSRGKPYKGKKKGAGRFVQLSERLQVTAAWAALKPGPRALYIEVRRRFNGFNNGRIVLSHREAAAALNVHRNTVGPWFETLIEHGLIKLTQRPFLGPDGVGRSALIALTDLPCDGKPASREYEQWAEIAFPRTEKRTPRHRKQDGSGKTAPSARLGVTDSVT